MQSVSNERKRNQRKSPLTPKKTFRKEDSPPAVRVGGRVKKAKIPFDPSDAVTKRRQTDTYLPTKRFAGKDGPVAQYPCCICKKFDKPDVLVTCKADCSTKIHLTCLQTICENFGKNEEKSWECNNCQSCTICSKGFSNGNLLIKCYICFSYYHPKCHGDENKIKIVKENRFCCGFCDKSSKITTPPSNVAKGAVPKKTRAFSQTRNKPNRTDCKFAGDGQIGFLGFPDADEVIEDSSTDDESNGTIQYNSRLSRPSQSHPAQRSSMSSNPSSVDDDVSRIDASNWSADQVFKYFKNIFPRHAHVFKDHEIDGPTLYLLKRGDIIRGFDIKIGPAIQIYSHIVKLQAKSNDLTLTWQ